MDGESERGLIHAYLLNGKGGADELSYEEAMLWNKDRGILWLHFDLSEKQTLEWLLHDSKLDPLLVETILDEEEPRPRCTQIGDGLLIVLRAVNHNPGADPDDMLVMRIWAEAGRVITFSNAKLLAVRYIQRKIISGIGPVDTVTMIEEIGECILDRVSETVADIEDFLDEVEDKLIAEQEDEDMMGEISEIRRQLSTIKRYLSPQRDAMESIPRQLVTWMNKNSRYQLKETAHRLTRILEDIENLRERALINIDELNSAMNQDAQRNMYMISVLAAFFLPLTFITGLLGINVGGIPFENHDHGFLIICIIVAVLSAILITLFKKIKWI